MKKIWAAFLLPLFLLSACGAIPAEPVLQASSGAASSAFAQAASNSAAASSSLAPGATSQGSTAPSDAQTVEKPYGSFSIPADWYEEESFSTDTQAFYLKTGTSLATPTSNITVSEGTNKYAADDYQSFAKAIDQQLRAQVTSDVSSYTGGGSFTDNGYPLITMTIETDQTLTTQYYIVGDRRFVMIHSTDFYDENIQDLAEAALTMVNSFQWN